MLNKILHKVRLSWFFLGFFVMYGAIAVIVPGAVFTAGALTLFSVNSFLYGFYIAPVLGGQKTRIEEMAKAIRAEANCLFDLLLKTQPLHKKTQDTLQDMFGAYIAACVRQRKIAEGEEEYEKLITFCLQYKGDDKDQIAKILKGLVANQQNRSNLAMQLSSRVFSNEWWIMLVLFSITLGFVLFLNVGDQPIMYLIKALLCTGLSMLMINLLKLSTLTHKKAKSIWDPMHKLLTTRFRRID